MSVGAASFAIIWPLLSFLTFIAALIINYIVSIALISDESVADIARKYELMITPSNWTFAIWGFIYAWQFLWMTYILFLCCRYDMKDIIIGKPFYIVFSISNILNACWIITWCNQYIVVAAILLILTTICLYTNLIASHCYIMIKANGNSSFYDYDSEIPYWLNEKMQSILIFLVLNGISFYAQWVLIACCLNFGVVLCYKAGVTNECASFISLGILTCLLIFYWCFDFNRKFGKILRFTYSPYIVLIIAFCGIVTKHGIDPDLYPPSIMALILLVITCIASALKVYVSIFAFRDGSSWDDSFLSVDY